MKTREQLRLEYDEMHGELVKPTQGWDSLYAVLHLAYSMGIKRGYYDVGTYARKPGDHSFGDRAGKPGQALAFDLRRKGWRGRFGWAWANSLLLARFYWKHHVALDIDYVIRGRKIISRAKPHWHPLTTGDTSHDWHIHVSGWVPAKDL